MGKQELEVRDTSLVPICLSRSTYQSVAATQEFGKLGHTTHSKAAPTRIVALPYHLSSEFGRYC